MVPGGGVVTGPRSSVTLAAGIARARHHKGPQVWPERELPIPGRPGVFHAIDVVDLGMHCGTRPKARLFDAMLHIIGHRLTWVGENGGLVHVVPEAGYAHGNEILVKTAPPIPSSLAREVWKDRRARPDRPDIILAILLDEVVARLARIVRSVALVWHVRNMQIGDDDRMELLRCQLTDKARKVRKCRRIDREGAVFVLKVDVKPQHIGRDMIVTQPGRDLLYPRTRRVTVARLLVSKRPKRRQGRRTGQPGVGFYNLLRFRTVQKIVVERTVRSGERVAIRAFVAEVEEGTERVVEEHTDRAA